MPATVWVPPVSSGTEDPFNLSTMPRKKHASPRGLCHPSAKKNQNIPHSGFAFETDDLTRTTWFSNPFFSLRLFLSVDVTQSGPAYPATLACRSDADLNQHAPCFFFFISMSTEKKPTSQNRGLQSIATAFQEHKRGTLKRSCTQ